MSKRRAATELNHDNWDREEEPETAGTFKQASKEIVQERVIRVAKRRLPAGASSSVDGNSTEPKKLFSGFTGFGNLKSSGNLSSVSEMAKNSFSFLNKTDAPKNTLKSSDTPLKTNLTESKSGNGNTDGDAHQTYLGKLKGLNEAVVNWIKEHVDKNPCCILTPVFNDYDKFLKEIELEKDKSANKTVSNKEASTFSVNSENKSSLFSFLNDKEADKSSAPTFSFGDKGKSPLTKKESPEKVAPPSFSFGSKNASENKINFSFGPAGDQSKQFSLGGNKHSSSEAADGPPEKKSFFNFGSTDKPSSDSSKFATSLFGGPPSGGGFFKDLTKPSETNTENNEEEEDEEPKPEPVKPVTEDDALYTQRVKVFVKKGEEYKDLGVGNLFIKEAPNGWHQALVRNDTSLGNIIFNILLSQQQPSKRMGKNNVMIVCQPTPQHTGPAVPVLLRVKTSEDADKLLEIIEKYKKK